MHRDSKEESLYLLIELITFLDGYRVAHCKDPAIIDKKISERKMVGVNRNIKQIWKSVKKDLYKVANFPMSLPSVARLAKFQSLFRMIETIMLVLTFSLGLVSLLTHAPIFHGILPTALIALLISFSSAFLLEKFLGRKIAIEIDNFYKTHPVKFEKVFKRLKTIVQRLIDDLNANIDKQKRDPEKFKFGLYDVDYSGIKIVNEPSPTRNYFLVMPSINQK